MRDLIDEVGDAALATAIRSGRRRPHQRHRRQWRVRPRINDLNFLQTDAAINPGNSGARWWRWTAG